MKLVSAPLEIGLAFDTGTEGVFAVQDYALANQKSVRVERASGSDRRLICSSETPCDFFVQIYRQRLSDKKTFGKWYIASMQLIHSEHCNSIQRLTSRQIAELPAFMAAVQANSATSIEALVATVQEQHGVTLDKQIRLVYRARDLVRKGKAAARSNMLPNQDVPIPIRQFVRCQGREKKTLSLPKKINTSGRLVWTDILIESLLMERIVKRGKQFIETEEQKQHRELWEIVTKDFNAKHNVNATVTQLRAKFRYLQDQFFRVRNEKTDATKDSEKVVVYPRCWELLVEHFVDEESQRNPNVNKDDTRPITNDSQIPSMPSEVNNDVPVQSDPVSLIQPNPVVVNMPPVQPVLAQPTPIDLSPGQDVSQTQVSMTRQVPLPVLPNMASKRRRKNSPEAATIQQNQHSVVSSNADAVCRIAEQLDVIHTNQRDMVRFLDSIKESMNQSNEAIRDLQQTLNQSNQVNAALLDLLQR
ncbi:unnamed protein product [Peronospora destructor]|uniref:Myb/SANT-like domain-containing protein n=1 Tax=Peronospora destructor TaxID=86335 RepID=A0AAV0TNR3_9STRA|nr:unnamed protein product [Peronospora destructor]